MKHLTYLFALLALVSMAMPGCTNDDPSNNDDPNVKCTFGEVGSNSIDLVLSTSGINEYAYFATSDMSVNPDAATIFKDGIMGKLKNGDNAVKVVDLDPATEYNLFVTTKTGTDYGKVYSTKFTTKSYTSMVTMIEVEDYFSVKFHIEVPKVRILPMRWSMESTTVSAVRISAWSMRIV